MENSIRLPLVPFKKSTIKCSSMESGVFPCTLNLLLEGNHIIYTTFTIIVAECTETHGQLLSPPGKGSLNVPVADWGDLTSQGLDKE